MKEQGCMFPDDMKIGYDNYLLNYLDLNWRLERNFKKFTIFNRFFKVKTPGKYLKILN